MTDDSYAYGKVLGRNISAARGRLQLSQAAIARRMKVIGFEWHQQTAGAIEKGTRRVTAEEIFGLSVVLRTSIAALMAPADEDPVVELPSGDKVSAELVRLSARGDVAGKSRWDVRWKDDEPLFPPLEHQGRPMGWFRRGEDEPGGE
jgi:transcriptional regulator with XRE-family HTH domain